MIASAMWCAANQEMLNNYAVLGWRLKDIIWHEGNLAAFILEAGGPQAPEGLQLQRIETKLDELLDQQPNRRKFKLQSKEEQD